MSAQRLTHTHTHTHTRIKPKTKNANLHVSHALYARFRPRVRLMLKATDAVPVQQRLRTSPTHRIRSAAADAPGVVNVHNNVAQSKPPTLFQPIRHHLSTTLLINQSNEPGQALTLETRTAPVLL